MTDLAANPPARPLPPARIRTRSPQGAAPPPARPAIPSPPSAAAVVSARSAPEHAEDLQAPAKRDYEVGYGKPPKAHQFQKGQSGNPKGRKRGSRNVATILRERLGEMVTTTVNGRKMRETTLEVIVRGLVVSIVTKRDPEKTMKFLRRVEEMGIADDKTANTVEAPREEGLEADDLALIQRMVERYATPPTDQP